MLLPGSIGMGHHALAEAVSEDLAGRGWTTETADVMALLGGVGHRLGERTFRSLLSTPGACRGPDRSAAASGSVRGSALARGQRLRHSGVGDEPAEA
jgi:hypothetical protein